MQPDISFMGRVGIAVALFLLLGFLLLPSKVPTPPAAPPQIESVPPHLADAEFAGSPAVRVLPHSAAMPALTPPDQTILSDAPHPEALAFGSPAIPAAREPEILLGFLLQYRERFGQFPAAEDNAQFMHALQGMNPGHLVIFPFRHERLNSSGALLDPWGKPFFFHQLSRDHIEVRSAGPDGQFYTGDDLLAPRRPGVPEELDNSARALAQSEE